MAIIGAQKRCGASHACITYILLFQNADVICGFIVDIPSRSNLHSPQLQSQHLNDKLLCPSIYDLCGQSKSRILCHFCNRWTISLPPTLYITKKNPKHSSIAVWLEFRLTKASGRWKQKTSFNSFFSRTYVLFFSIYFAYGGGEHGRILGIWKCHLYVLLCAAIRLRLWENAQQ